MGRRLLVASDTLVGGQGGAVVRHVAWFASRGWDVTVAAPAGEATGLRVDNHVAVPVPATARDVRRMWRAARDLRGLIARIRPEVVHCHGARSFVVALLAGARRPYVTLHGIMPVPSDPAGYRHVRLAGLAVLPRLARAAFTVAPNAPPGWVFTPHASDRLATLAPLGPPTSPEPTFLWVGRLDEPKRPETFVRAMASVGGARGLIAGTGELEGRVRALIADTGAPVEMLGFVTDVTELLRAAWAVVLFSDHEGVPFSLEEAMWAGRAVASSPIPGVEWLVDDRRFLAADPAGAAGVLTALTDRDTAERAGAANAARIRTLLTADDPWPVIERWYA